jgi:hypothetical protein
VIQASIPDNSKLRDSVGKGAFSGAAREEIFGGRAVQA